MLTSGKRHALGGTFYEPTVLVDASSSMLIAQEETFGPCCAASFASRPKTKLLPAANATPLDSPRICATRDLARAWRVGEALESGMVGINEGIVSTGVAPFGGVKQIGRLAAKGRSTDSMKLHRASVPDDGRLRGADR